MAKKIYINGGIVVTTPYFRAIDAGAYFETPPEGAEVVEANKIDENGNAYLEISEKYPHSIFAEYFVKDEFTVTVLKAPFLYNDYKDVYDNYKERINNITEIIDLPIDSVKHRDILYRMFYMNIITSLETFVSDIIITKITSSLESMNDHVVLLSENAQNKLDTLEGAEWEQSLIEYAMRKTYSGIKVIKEDLKTLFNISITDTKGKIKNHFYYRHLLAHKNGRRKDDDYFTPTKNKLLELISDTDQFAEQIFNKVV